MNVLAIGAHPDDLEILTAGTLALYARAGRQVTMCVMTNGELGSDTPTRGDTAALRRTEAEASAKIIGAQFHCLEQPDGFLYDVVVTTSARPVRWWRPARPRRGVRGARLSRQSPPPSWTVRRR